MFLLFWLFVVSTSIHRRVIYTPILNFLPLKQHHLVVLNDYTVDFSPVNFSTTRNKVILKLLLGKNVTGEVRLRYIGPAKNDAEIIKIWGKPYSEPESRALTLSTYQTIKDNDLKMVVKKIMKWNETMNLYKRNCQHFSRFVKSI